MRSRNCAGCGSIDLEIIRVLEAGNALKESPDYELRWLTTRTPAFFDETVKRHVQALEKELALLEREATELAKEREIDHLPGTVGMGIEYDRSALPRAASRATFRRWIRRLAGSND